MYLKPQGDPRAPRSRDRARAVRRRRTVAGLVLLVLVVAAIAVASSGGGGSGGSGGATPSFGGGPGAATVIGQDTPGQAPPSASHAASFTPAPAAVALAARLPLAGQVAQLFLIGVDGTDTSSPAVAAFAANDWGGAALSRANFLSDSQIGSLAAGITALAKNAGNVAPLIAAPQEGGPDTAFPDLPPEGEAAIGASGSPATAQAQALLAGKQLRALGVNMTFAPLADVDVLSGALSGRLFSTSPHAVGVYATAAVAGYQSAGEISAAGHFPGAGAASADPDAMSATVGGSVQSLAQRDLRPFAAIAPTVPVIMMSNAGYAAFDGTTPAGLVPQAVQLLRNRLGFGGVIMTDDLDAALLATGASAGQAAVSALGAGDDLLYITGSPAEQLSAYHAVLSAVQSGHISRARIRDALLRDLTLKAHYGLI
ncbi:MAG TPA: glycoside hydrolase family 3 N-terminal domain-containing protein [Solirubrobacteraceae bacterium]|nr:glycoside hydrolase family 3 N-terminal domain-containing protein [Solirubrobacteraceae bacterium]